MGLVRLRTFRRGLVRCKLEHRCWRARGEYVSFTDVKIKIPWGCEWRHAPEVQAEDFGRFEKSQLSWELDTEREGSTFGAHRGQTNLRATGATRVWGEADGKASIERLCISLSYVEEPLNSKVIKNFVPELRSRKCFSCFEIPMFYVYISWTFYVRFTRSRIWLWYTTGIYIYIYIYCYDRSLRVNK